MAAAFPLSPAPSWYGQAAWHASVQPRNGIFYLGGDAPTITLSKAGATGYSVCGYDGTIISSGGLDGSTTVVAPAAPAGGWKCGWYRIYFTGPNNDPLFADSYSITNFVIVPDDSRFIPTPAGNTAAADAGGEAADLIAKGVLGIGSSRIIVAENNSNLTAAEAMAAQGASYWTNPGAQYLDPGRARYLWAAMSYKSAADAADVTAAVQALYPLGVTHFEGPYNEPTVSDALALEQGFVAAVHAGNANAKAIGPTFVDFGNWSSYLASGGGTFFDEFATHAYNSSTSGDLNLARHMLSQFFALLAFYGFAAKQVWQTESTGAMTPVYAVHHPRRARCELLDRLVWEEFGVARERNNPWYDTSHGYWSIPRWWENGDGSLQPQAVLNRTLAAETWGQTFRSRLVFPGMADNIFAGWLYASATAQTCVLVTTAPIPGSAVTITTDAPGPLTIVDSWGNTSTVPVSGGAAVVAVAETPTYVRLPVAATCAIATVNGWNLETGIVAVDGARASAATVDGVAAAVTAGFINDYPTQNGIFVSSTAVPSVVEIVFPLPTFAERLLVWCGSAWQSDSAFSSFSVDVSYDGTSWAAGVASVDVSAAASAFQAGSDSNNVGCEYETYWPEQWIFDLPLTLTGPVRKLRLDVSGTSYGGEPTAACVAAGGQGNPDQHVALQRIAVLGRKACEIGSRVMAAG